MISVSESVKFWFIKPEKNIFYIRTCDSKASPGLGGVELAGSAGVHLDEDPVSLLRDVESSVQLVRSFVYYSHNIYYLNI